MLEQCAAKAAASSSSASSSGGGSSKLLSGGEDKRSWYKAAGAAMAADDYQKALKLYTFAISKAPTPDGELHVGRSGALVELNRYDEALADADRAVQIDPILLMRTTHGARPVCDPANTGANRWWEEAKAAFIAKVRTSSTRD